MRFTVQSYPLWSKAEKVEDLEQEGYGVSIDGEIFEYRDKTISEKQAVMKALKTVFGE